MGGGLPLRLPQPGAPLSFDIAIDDSGLVVRLAGWDRLANWRGTVRVPRSAAQAAWVEERGILEALVQHRVVGMGTHAGGARPGRRRVGTMMGRGHVGRQFWAVGTEGAALPCRRVG